MDEPKGPFSTVLIVKKAFNTSPESDNIRYSGWFESVLRLVKVIE